MTSFLFNEKENRVVDIIFFNPSQLLMMLQTRCQTLSPVGKQSNNNKGMKKWKEISSLKP